MSDEATTPSPDDRQAQLAELRSLVTSGVIDAAEYERRRYQIITPGATPKSEWKWREDLTTDADDVDDVTPHTPTQWVIAFAVCIVLGGLSGYAIEADWSGVIIGAVLIGGAMLAIDVLKGN